MEELISNILINYMNDKIQYNFNLILNFIQEKDN